MKHSSCKPVLHVVPVLASPNVELFVRGVPVLVPVRASPPVPSVVKGSFILISIYEKI